jgi:hypothetical protein
MERGSQRQTALSRHPAAFALALLALLAVDMQCR